MQSQFQWSQYCGPGNAVSEIQSRKCVLDPVSVFHCFCLFLFFIYLFIFCLNSEILAVAVSRIGIRTQCFRTQVRDCDGTRCASIIVLKLIGKSIKGKKKIHLKIHFSVESMLPILSIHCSILHYEHITIIGLPYVDLRHSVVAPSSLWNMFWQSPWNEENTLENSYWLETWG